MSALAFLLSNWRTVGVLALGLGLAGYIAVLRIERDKARSDLALELSQFETFKVKVAAEGEIARQRAQAIAAHDGLLKEEADETHRQALDRLHADIRRMRHDTDAARSRFLSAAPACPASADAAAYRAEFESAYRELVQEVRGAGLEGDEEIVGLNTAKRWAQHDRDRVP